MGDLTETLHYLSTDEGWSKCTQQDLEAAAKRMAILTCESERVTQAATSAAEEGQTFPVQEVNILPHSVETQGLTHNRPAVDPAPYVLDPMPKRQHGMYYTGTQYTQMPSQLLYTYSYPVAPPPTHSDTPGGFYHPVPDHRWTMDHLSGDSPADGDRVNINTPDDPITGPWNIPGDIPHFDDLMGVDLRAQFDAEASSRRPPPPRRNPDRNARRWDRPCGTSDRHHHH